MKNKRIFIFLLCFLIIGIQYSIAQEEPEQKNGLFGLSYEFQISEPFATGLPADNGTLFLSNEWGGGDDTPDPSKPTTGGDIPIGNGIFVMLLLAGLFLGSKGRIRGE